MGLYNKAVTQDSGKRGGLLSRAQTLTGSASRQVTPITISEEKKKHSKSFSRIATQS